MGGTIGVKSEPGRGSEFFFTASFARAPADNFHDEIFLQCAQALQGLRLLIIDDSAMARESLCVYAEGFGWRCEATTDLADGLVRVERRAAEGAPFAVVLLDWRRPDLNGPDAIRRLEEAGGSAARIVILTNAFQLGDEWRTMDVEGARVITTLSKPATPSMLFDAVAGALGHQPRSDANPIHDPLSACLNGTRLLLVEDNLINQEVARSLLERQGATIITAGNGREAMECLARSAVDFDAVLMDLQMPEMSGYEATRAIRAQPRFATLPIIAMTADAMTGDREKCLEAGMNDHVAKPIDPPHLYTTLAHWLGRQAPNRPSGGPTADEPCLPIKSINTPAGLSRFGGDERLYVSLLESFLAKNLAVAAQLQQAIALGHMDQVRQAAHGIKGVAANLGAEALASMASNLEQAAREATKSDPGADLTAVQAAFNCFKPSLCLGAGRT